MLKLYNLLKITLVLMLVVPVASAFAQIQVTGTVTDETGPAPNVSVVVVGSTGGTQTNAKGQYAISVQKGATLRFSYVGYSPKEILVGDQTVINVKLGATNNQLNEVVVTSFGIKRQERSLGYATSTVSAKELTEAGNTNFASALYGKAPGVRLTTSPGGASSAVNLTIRGINSLGYNAQPLLVVDGVIVRNDNQNATSGGGNNGGFFDDQRIRGNGILDINPEDIESLTVLKGASATALYGSDASAGVLVITTKKGIKGKGPTVDVNYYGTIEQPAFLPKFQNVYGQGYDRATNLAVGATEEGWIADAKSPSGYRPNFRAYAEFGPKMDGQQVRWWDGSIRSYSPQPNNYRDIFQTGFSSLANVALSNQTDNADYRISASRLDYDGIQRKSNQQKNTFSLNSTLKFGSKVSVDVIANYVNTLTHNRPYLTNRLAASYDGFFGREEDMNLILNKYQTSQGYAWVPLEQASRNPAEAFTFRVRPNLYDYFFSTLRNTYDETENRLYNSATLNWQLIKKLKFRGRIGSDYTGGNTEDKQYNQYPVAFNTGNSTGAYGIGKYDYSILYGDALLTYADKIAKNFNFTVSAGYTARRERYYNQNSGTSAGLVTENFFSLSNSFGILGTSSTRQEFIKSGYFGLLNFSYKNFLFLEGTARQESSSTLPPQNNSYFYPSVNGGFVFTDVFEGLKSFMSFGKLRASYGVVGNPSPAYRSNILYSLSSLQTFNGSVPQLALASNYGNSELKPEKKHEAETGLEMRFLNDRIGIDATYYQNKINNIILDLQVAPSNGAASQIVNAGQIGNRGFEIGLNGTPFTGAFRWQSRLNFTINRSKVYSLAPGIPQLTFYSAEQNAVVISAKPGEEIGNIYVNPLLTDAKGNKVINSDGFHITDYSHYVKAGNVLPKVTGGFSNTFSYKNLSLTTLVDYRFGGQIVSSPQKYSLGAGMYESTLKYRDAAHGGLPYYINTAGTYVPLPATATTGPAGQKVYHDGLILPGVTESGQPNTVMIDAASYYENEFNYGSDSNNQDGTIYDNSYIKMRELTLGYRLPTSLVKRIGMSNMRVSLIGRNLFYFWKTLKNLDPETVVGNQWYRQGVDEGSVPATRSFGLSLNASF